MGPQNSKSLKYWANDERGLMSGLFYSLKIGQFGSVCTKPQKFA